MRTFMVYHTSYDPVKKQFNIYRDEIPDYAMKKFEEHKKAEAETAARLFDLTAEELETIRRIVKEESIC